MSEYELGKKHEAIRNLQADITDLKKEIES